MNLNCFDILNFKKNNYFLFTFGTDSSHRRVAFSQIVYAGTHCIVLVVVLLILILYNKYTYTREDKVVSQNHTESWLFSY
jgi:hypothetical protein